MSDWFDDDHDFPPSASLPEADANSWTDANNWTAEVGAPVGQWRNLNPSPYSPAGEIQGFAALASGLRGRGKRRRWLSIVVLVLLIGTLLGSIVPVFLGTH